MPSLGAEVCGSATAACGVTGVGDPVPHRWGENWIQAASKIQT